MNDRIFNRLTEISVALKSKRQTGRTFHTTFILEKKRIISIGINNLEKATQRPPSSIMSGKRKVRLLRHFILKWMDGSSWAKQIVLNILS